MHLLSLPGVGVPDLLHQTEARQKSELTRLVRLFANRFSVQERIGEEFADTLEAMMEPYGVAVYLKAHHLCTQTRGVRESSPKTRTTFWRGKYEKNPALRSEFYVACGPQR